MIMVIPRYLICPYMTSNSTHCFGLMGYPGAGKSYGADIVADHFGVDAIAIGDVVRDRATDALGADADSDAIGEWVTEQLDEDEEAINSWVIEEIRSRDGDADYAVIDGIRTVSDVEVFSDAFDTFSLIYVHATPETRLERLQDRGRDGEEDFTMEDLKRRDAREDEWGTGTLIDEEYYDVAVGNDLPDKFAGKLVNAVDGLAATPTQSD